MIIQPAEEVFFFRLGEQTLSICETISAILDCESRGRLERVESVTKGVSVWHLPQVLQIFWLLFKPEFWSRCILRKRAALVANDN